MDEINCKSPPSYRVLAGHKGTLNLLVLMSLSMGAMCNHLQGTKARNILVLISLYMGQRATDLHHGLSITGDQSVGPAGQ